MYATRRVHGSRTTDRLGSRGMPMHCNGRASRSAWQRSVGKVTLNRSKGAPCPVMRGLLRLHRRRRLRLRETASNRPHQPANGTAFRERQGKVYSKTSGGWYPGMSRRSQLPQGQHKATSCTRLTSRTRHVRGRRRSRTRCVRRLYGGRLGWTRSCQRECVRRRIHGRLAQPEGLPSVCLPLLPF